VRDGGREEGRAGQGRAGRVVERGRDDGEATKCRQTENARDRGGPGVGGKVLLPRPATGYTSDPAVDV